MIDIKKIMITNARVFFIVCIFAISAILFYAQTAYADEISVPDKSITITEEDFPLSGGEYYKITPKVDVIIRSHFASNTRVYIESNGRCIAVDHEYVSPFFEFYTFYLGLGNTYYIATDTNLNLYECVKVTLDPNGGVYKNNGTDLLYAHMPKLNTVDNGAPIFYEIINVNGNACENISRDGYAFGEWNTKPDGTGYNAHEYDSFSKDIIFYAKWRKQINLSLYANGGSFIGKTIDPNTDDYKKTNKIVLTGSEENVGEGVEFNLDYHYSNTEGYDKLPRREGFTLKEWNTQSDGTGTGYGSEAEGARNIGVFKDDASLYAIWMCTEDNHKYGEWTITKEASCTEDGLREKPCTICGDTVTETIPATGTHLYGAWAVTKSATEAAPGVQTRICTHCGHKVKAAITMLKPTLPAVTIKAPKAAKKAATVKWKKLSKKKLKKIGYIQIQYSTDKAFKVGVKTVTAKKTTVSKKISRLISKKVYYVRIRSYLKSGSKVYVSKWSSVKKVKAR